MIRVARLSRIPPGCLAIWYAAQAREGARQWMNRARESQYPEVKQMSVHFARQDWHSYLREMRTIKERT